MVEGFEGVGHVLVCRHSIESNNCSNFFLAVKESLTCNQFTLFQATEQYFQEV